MEAGLERLKRIVDVRREERRAVLLENLNKEPDDAEVHYLAHTVEEWRYYYERIQSPAFGFRSRPTTRISCPTASTASSTRST